jgi:hypothetical protein
MSAILDFCRYACYVTTGVTQYFYLDNHQSFCTQNYTLYANQPMETSRSLETFKTSTNQYLVCNEYFYMVNPCCDVTKTTVNEIKKITQDGWHLTTSSENISRTKQDMKNR